MSEFDVESENCPPRDSTYMESLGTGDKGQIIFPSNWVSYRITSDSRDEVFDLFDGCRCVIGDEVSSKGVRHFHVVVAGHDSYDRIKKRIQRLRLGRAKCWSEKNSGTFVKAVQYTIKDGDYYSRGFSDYIAALPPYDAGDADRLAPPSLVKKDTSADWMLTYNNILPVALNWRNAHQLMTDDLGIVLRHMTANSKWIPSPQMLKTGSLDPWHFAMFRFRCGTELSPPDWWTPRAEADYRFHSRTI